MTSRRSSRVRRTANERSPGPAIGSAKSPSWRVYAGGEGTQDEVSLITEAQWHLRPNMFVRFNTGVGLTSKATDWTPELGILLTLPTR